MWRYSTGTRQQLPPQLFEQMGHYRREVFINQLGWALNTIHGMELDQFDGPEAVYVCSHDEDGNVNGVARLLPTTGPYLMEKVFPQLWAGNEMPCDPKIWELSRFAMVDQAKSTAVSLRQASSVAATTLLRQVIRAADANGAKSLITVSPVAMEQLLRLNGFDVRRAGLPTFQQDAYIVALHLNLATQLLTASRGAVGTYVF